MVNQTIPIANTRTLVYPIMSRPLSIFNTSLRASSSLRRPISAIPRAHVRFLATPTTGPQTVSSGPIKTPHPLDASTKTNNDEGSRHQGEQQSGSAAAVKASQAWPDYSKGPSALDKASQLFFFTEIVRGKLNPT
jgi:NADH dehydrogenase (ubiquinone) Fe-S protein 8